MASTTPPEVQKLIEEVRKLKGNYQFTLRHEESKGVTYGNTSSCNDRGCTPSNTDACTL